MPSHSYLLHLRTTKKQEKRLIGALCSVFAVLMPLTTLPQIYLLYTTHDTRGLSLSMWVLYAIGVIPFLLFGIINRYRQLVVLNVLWLMAQAVIITGILLYR